MMGEGAQSARRLSAASVAINSYALKERLPTIHRLQEYAVVMVAYRHQFH
jgi:hypothetical protein